MPTLEPLSLKNAKCFIEEQFPVAKVSAESYKERKAGGSQTLVGLGNWKGRKPLVLVRATLLGLLLPTSDDPVKDREIFLKLMTMDDEGLWMRKDKSINPGNILQTLDNLPPHIKNLYTENNELKKMSAEERTQLQKLVFQRMSYSERLTYCQRPEHLPGPAEGAWGEINAHLGTDASNLQELVAQLGVARFGEELKVGDCFCGGGSIPFEAARLGAQAFGSDLNPLAGLLTWASLNLIGAGEEVVEQVKQNQKEVYDIVDQQIIAMGVEHNSLDWRADAFLYCVEVTDLETGWKIPLLPNFVISDKNRVIVQLVRQPENKSYKIVVIEKASEADYKTAARSATVRNSRLVPPDGSFGASIEDLRQGMRQWQKNDITSQPGDVFEERLYCVRWVEPYTEKGKTKTRRRYQSVTPEDLAREQQVIDFVQEHLQEWQALGYLPERRIEPGSETDRPSRERGWTHWQHLFTPRQLLLAGLLSKTALEKIRTGQLTNQQAIGLAAGLGRCVNFSSRLTIWNISPGKIEQTFYNQALNSLFNFGARGLVYLENMYNPNYPNYLCNESIVKVIDGRDISTNENIWITDPPYADAVNYDEISEFFLAWQAPYIAQLFPDWPTDSRRELAVRGRDEVFKQSMVAIYRRLNDNMPANGLQVVMFTHTSPAVWADLASILWAAGLRVTAAWTIATETDAIGLKSGNSVQGTVLMVLRRRTENHSLFQDEVQQKVEREVRRQLTSMTELDDDSDPNFGDSDYQLAAYAAALRVLTAQPIEEINPEREILITRKSGEISPVEAIIRQAVIIACDHLVPQGIDTRIWKTLGPMERFYLKGLEVESHGERRSGVYQELARGFGANDYANLLESGKANQTRLKTASEFTSRTRAGEDEFSNSLTRHCLYAIFKTSSSDEPREGVQYLRTELGDYWGNRDRILHLLDFFAHLRNISDMPDWSKDADSAVLLNGAVRNDHI